MTPVALVKLGNATYKVYIEWWRDCETNEWFVRKVMESHWKAGKASCAFFVFILQLCFCCCHLGAPVIPGVELACEAMAV